MFKTIIGYEPVYISGEGHYAYCVLACGHNAHVKMTRSKHIVLGKSKAKCQKCTKEKIEKTFP